MTCQKLGDKLVIFLFTTNVPHLVDPAFLRRAGGTTERFGRLTKKSFQSVLAKHLRGLPLAVANGDAEIVRREVIADVARTPARSSCSTPDPRRRTCDTAGTS